jgi:hypothetical protein
VHECVCASVRVCVPECACACCVCARAWWVRLLPYCETLWGPRLQMKLTLANARAPRNNGKQTHMTSAFPDGAGPAAIDLRSCATACLSASGHGGLSEGTPREFLEYP